MGAPGNNDSSGYNFAKMVQESRVVPEAPQGVPSAGTELPPTIAPKVRKNPFIQTTDDLAPEDKPGTEILMVHHSRVFVLWRPWEECARCGTMIAQQQVTIPLDEGDYECPHVQLEAYKAVMDMGLKGDCIIALKELFVQPNGTRCAHIEWLTPDKDAIRQQKKIEEEKRSNRVFPPDIEGAFAKK